MSWLKNFFEVEFFNQLTPIVICVIFDDDVRGGGRSVRWYLDEVEVPAHDDFRGWVKFPQLFELPMSDSRGGSGRQVDIHHTEGGEGRERGGGGEVRLGLEDQREDPAFGGVA